MMLDERKRAKDFGKTKENKMDMFSKRSISQKIGNGFLWNLLQIFGIGIFESKFTGTAAMIKFILKKIFPFILLSVPIYQIFAYFAYGIQWQFLMAFMVIDFLALVLWHRMYINRTLMRRLVIHLFKFNHLQKKQAKNRNKVVNLCLALAITIPSISAVLTLAYLHTASGFGKSYYSFFTEFEDDNSPKVIFIRFILLQLANALEFTYPAVVAVTCGSLYHKCSNLFSEFCEDIDAYHRRLPRRHEMFKLLQKQKLLYRLAHDVEDCLSTTTSLNICIQIFNMYVALATILVADSTYFTSSVIFKFFPTVTLIPANVVGIILCASRISFQIEKMRMKFKLIHDELISYDKTDWELVEFSRIIINTSFPKMTACGVVELTPGLILSIFGGLLSYGLLITNIK